MMQSPRSLGIISLLFLVILTAFGCAPASSSDSNPAAEIQLPTRPAGNSEILSRSLLYRNDPRVSYCELVDNQLTTYSGYRDTELQPLASLSKAITSSWALATLGADYRFQSHWYLNPVAGRPGIFDAYLRTNYDPVVNIEKILFYLSELNNLGVKGIRNLALDETTRSYLSVLSQPHIELSDVPNTSSDTIGNFRLILNSKNWGAGTLKARQNLTAWAQANKRSLNIPNSFTVETVFQRDANQINTKAYAIHKTVASAPLYKYLKNLNVYSNNYMADAFFDLLGGTAQFQNFQKTKLQLSLKEMQIYTGSGLADSSRGVRKDNLGSCFSVIKVLSYLKQTSENAGLNLGHILLNPSQDDDGTFTSNTNLNNSVVLKTGRLFENPAINLAGFVATNRGTLAFVFLGHDFTANEANDIERMRSQMLNDIQDKFSTQSQYSTLQEYGVFL